MPAPGSTRDSSLDHGAWPLERSAILDWLVHETRGERFLDNIFAQFCNKLRDIGIPLAGAGIYLQVLHPQWFAARMVWRPGRTEAEIETFDHDSGSASLQDSPMRLIYEGAPEVRRKLAGPEACREFEICRTLAAEGMTELVSWPFDFTLGKRHVITFAVDRPGGFEDEELRRIADFLPLLALVCEIRQKNRLARTLLDTYVGPHASGAILNGSITRGSGVTVSAVILICDLRGFTSISELWPRDDVTELLNEYFDAMSGPIEAHHGEILKFIGDGMLAIFPVDDPHACLNAMRAATEARANMKALNVRRQARGLDPLGYGVGIHVGDVMYGNIGSRGRLDFTVIGPAVNVASRIEGLTKLVGRNVLFSGAFVEALASDEGLDAVGAFPLRGVEMPIDIFALAESPSSEERSAA